MGFLLKARRGQETMPLENANTIAELNPAYPLGDDPVSSADDHIRLIKRVLKDAFGNSSPGDLKDGTVPSGLIAMWSGAAAAVPAGWFLCDGKNKTPDLRDRFIVGAGLAYTVGAKGGALNATTASGGSHTHTLNADGGHTHTGSTAGHVLTIAEIPAHDHESPWGESQPERAPFGVTGSGTNLGSGQSDGDNFHFNTNKTGGNQAHSHGMNLDPAPAHTHLVQSGGAHTHAVDVRPPYYALAYIMKA